MKEYIEREALMDEIHRIGGHNLCEWDTIGVKALVCRQPAADVVEVRHGYWFITEYEYFSCSECGNSYYNGCESTAEAKSRLKDGLYDNYCPNCGAKMDGKGEGG